jgi:hypothetical protein
VVWAGAVAGVWALFWARTGTASADATNNDINVRLVMVYFSSER